MGIQLFLFHRKTKQTSSPSSTMAKGKSAGAGKRVKKVLKANASSVSQGSIRRLARRGGVKRIAGPVYGEVRDVLRRSSMVLFVMPPPTLNTPSTRPSPSKTSSPLSASAVVLSTVSKKHDKNRNSFFFFFVFF